MARAWFAVGTQSVGGGSSMLILARQIFVERERWMTQREFLEDFVLCRLSPGIHNVALAGLMGQRLDGPRGVVLAVAALVLPSGLITAVMTAGYSFIRDEPLSRAILSGVGPVTLGLTAGFATTIARAATRNGRRAIVDWSVFAAAIAVGLWAGLPPLAVYLGGTLLGALILGREKRPPELPSA